MIPFSKLGYVCLTDNGGFLSFDPDRKLLFVVNYPFVGDLVTPFLLIDYRNAVVSFAQEWNRLHPRLKVRVVKVSVVLEAVR